MSKFDWSGVQIMRCILECFLCEVFIHPVQRKFSLWTLTFVWGVSPLPPHSLIGQTPSLLLTPRVHQSEERSRPSWIDLMIWRMWSVALPWAPPTSHLSLDQVHNFWRVLGVVICHPFYFYCTTLYNSSAFCYHGGIRFRQRKKMYYVNIIKVGAFYRRATLQRDLLAQVWAKQILPFVTFYLSTLVSKHFINYNSSLSPI